MKSKRIISLSKCLLLICAGAFLYNNPARCEVKLPYILSDNMVIQRDIPVNIWGWADPGEKVTVEFNNQKVSVKAGKTGEWKIQLKPVAAGGPFEMTIKGKNSIVLKNILAGDVWVCGGQSNMEWPLLNSRNWAKDKAEVENPNIRLFQVPKNLSMKALDNTKETNWQTCDEASAAAFSAIGYYFGKNLEKSIHVPIGLINSNWGGTDIETWMSLETMYMDNDFKAIIDKTRSVDFNNLQKEEEAYAAKYQNAINNEDPGIINKWFLPSTGFSDWKPMNIPQLWEGAGLPGFDGVVWFRKEFTVSATDAGKEGIISLGPIDDGDETYLNGTLIGKTNRYDAPRMYKVPAGLLKPGLNVLVIKVIDNGGGGGLWGTENQVYIDAGAKQSLAGEWKYKVGLDLPAPKNVSNPNSYPSRLYNGMINPLIKFPIKGVIWYQGENNVGNYIKYRSQFPALIKDWRNKWQIGDFTFLFVQLANYMEPSQVPQEKSTWAGLREAQTMTLSVPNTGMAVIIDIGEAKNIHPRNKDDVGYRLALAALKKAYGKDIVYSGPIYKSMKTEGNKIILDFDHVGSGLMVKDKYGYLKAFAIAGADKNFIWARAYVTPDNKVVVYSDNVSDPVAVRYAWADNPDDANLYNAEGLPASPFRTDNW